MSETDGSYNNYGIPGHRSGAVHDVDPGLVPGNPGNLIAWNTADTRKMADNSGPAIIAFGKTGNPDCDIISHWPTYSIGSISTMIFNTECRVEDDPTSELSLLREKI